MSSDMPCMYPVNKVQQKCGIGLGSLLNILIILGNIVIDIVLLA